MLLTAPSLRSTSRFCSTPAFHDIYRSLFDPLLFRAALSSFRAVPRSVQPFTAFRVALVLRRHPFYWKPIEWRTLHIFTKFLKPLNYAKHRQLKIVALLVNSARNSRKITGFSEKYRIMRYGPHNAAFHVIAESRLRDLPF